MKSIKCILREDKCTMFAQKVIPPIYFYGNYKRYKEHTNTI
jgi:hypothetical protein